MRKYGSTSKKTASELEYLQNKPIKIFWNVVAGEGKLDYYQSYDLIFDEYDLKIRGIMTEDNLIYLREVQK